MSIKARVLRGLAAGGFGQATTALIQLVGLPIFLRAWGVNLYGEWLIVSAIPVYLSLSDLGFANAASNEMNLLVARGDRAKALVAYQSVTALLMGAVLLVWGLAAIFGTLQHTRFGFALTTLSGVELDSVVAAFALQVSLALMINLAHAGYRCEHNYARGLFLAHLLRLTEFLVTIAVLWKHGGPAAVAWTTVGVRALGVAAIHRDLAGRSSWLRFGFSLASRKQIIWLVKPAMGFMAFPLAFATTQQGIVLIIGAILGPASVVAFTAMRTISRLVFQVFGILQGTLMPEISHAYGQNDLSLAASLHRRALHYSLWLSLISVPVLLAASPVVMRHWVHGEVTLDMRVFFLLLVQVVVNLVWHTSSSIPLALNQHTRLALAYVLISIVALVPIAALTSLYGLIGGTAALIAVDVLMVYVVVPQSLNLLNEGAGTFWKTVLTPPQLAKALGGHWRN